MFKTKKNRIMFYILSLIFIITVMIIFIEAIKTLETKDKLNNKQEEIVIMEENSTEEKVIKNKHSLKYRAQAELIDKVIIILGFNFIAVFLEEIIFNVFLPKDYFKEKNKI